MSSCLFEIRRILRVAVPSAPAACISFTKCTICVSTLYIYYSLKKNVNALYLKFTLIQRQENHRPAAGSFRFWHVWRWPFKFIPDLFPTYAVLKSRGYSQSASLLDPVHLFCCKQVFIYISCDTIVLNLIPAVCITNCRYVCTGCDGIDDLSILSRCLAHICSCRSLNRERFCVKLYSVLNIRRRCTC